MESQTEQKILDAATAVFLQKGRDGARMQEIADRAGINKALLHYYFRSKEKLYETVFSFQIRNYFSEIFQTVSTSKDIFQFVDYFVNAYIDKITEHPELIRFIQWEIGNDDQRIGNVIKGVMSDIKTKKNPMLAVVERAVAEKQIRPVEPLHFILNLVSMCIYPFVAKPILKQMFPEGDFDSEMFVEKRKQQILDMIWHGVVK